DSAHIELTRRSLENSGAEFNLHTAPAITDAFTLLKDNDYDVILSDYRLPDGSGLDVIRIAHEQNLSTAIVLITNQEDINTAVAALKAGAVDYIVKQSDYLHKLPIVLGNAYKHTQIEKQKKALNEIENKYRNIYENAVEGIFQSSPDGRFLSINPAMAQIYGYKSPEEMIKKISDISTQIYLSANTRNQFTEALKRDGVVEKFEARNLKKDGGVIWTSTNARVVKDKNGKILYYEGFVTDVTDQKYAEEAIKANEGSYRGLFNSVTQAIYIQDKEGRFLDVNDGAITMYGYPRDFFIGKTPEVLSAPNKNDLNSLVKMTERAFAGEPQEFEFWGLRSNSQVFPKIVTLNKGTYFGQDVIIAIAQDITARKQAEKLLERQLKALAVLHAASMAGTQSNTEDEIIEQVTRITASIYSDVCGVLLLNDQGNVLIPHPSYMGANIVNWKNGYPITEGITGRAVRTGGSIRINDTTKDPNYIEIASKTKSELCVPFRVHERIIGVFNVESKQINAFDEEDERLLNTIAGGLGTAIEKLRLFEAEQAQRQREAAMLDLIRVAASSLDLNQVLQSILDQLIKVIPSDCGSVQLLDGDHLNILAAIGNEAINFATRGALPLSEFPLNNYVVTEKQTVRVDNALLDDRYKFFNEVKNIRSFLGIPLIAKDKTIGMITLDSYQISHFTEQDAELGLALANQAAIAMENARLFQEESRRAQIIEAMANIANEIALTQEVIPALDKIAQR
ncbi:MAG: GAF domain-containing protein, partial [Anaerolineales bacterium]|nr:GAF domain-containing protein [Anaerolineales bacterium]